MAPTIAESTVSDILKRAVALHQSGQLSEAEKLYRDILRDQPKHPDALYLLGTVHFQQRNLGSAILFLRKALEVAPHHVDARYNLGLAYFQKGELENANNCLRENIRRQPNHWQSWFSLGNGLRHAGNFADAIQCNRKVLDLVPDYAPAYDNLAQCLRAQGDLQQSLEASDLAVESDPQLAVAWNTRGAILQDQGHFQDAIGCYQQAVRLAPQFVEARFNLGSLLLRLREFSEADTQLREVIRLRPEQAEAIHMLGLIQHHRGDDVSAVAFYSRALQLRPNFPDAINNLGTSLCRINEWDEAIECYRSTVKLKPDHFLAWKNLAATLEQRGIYDEARHAFSQAIQLQPKDTLLRMRADCCCELIFDSNEQIDRYRSGLLDRLAEYAEHGVSADLDALVASDVRPPFYLQFHGRDERPMREAFAKVFAKNFENEPLTRSNAKPKVGFVVTHGHHYSFCRSIGGMFAYFSDAIEPVIICSPADAKQIAVTMKNPKLRFLLLPTRPVQMAEFIRQANFDVLYYWEVGTGSQNYFLPFCRLASVQCTSWGIQLTSGIPNMDVYLSSKQMEAEGAKAHYTERLHLLETMLSYQIPAPRPANPKPREHFGLSSNRNIYLCAQHLGKFHPDFDPILAQILDADPAGEIVITRGNIKGAMERLQERFRRTLGALADRVRFLDQQSGEDYYSLILAADVLLDPLHFGGVNTTYDALSFGKAIVTLPSSFQRGRYTLGCFQMMGFTDCVAQTPAEYVAKAVKIATDSEWREHLESVLTEKAQILFHCRQSAHELEQALVQLVG